LQLTCPLESLRVNVKVAVVQVESAEAEFSTPIAWAGVSAAAPLPVLPTRVFEPTVRPLTVVAEAKVAISPVVIAPEIEASVAEIAAFRFASVGVSSQVCTPVPNEKPPKAPLLLNCTWPFVPPGVPPPLELTV